VHLPESGELDSAFFQNPASWIVLIPKSGELDSAFFQNPASWIVLIPKSGELDSAYSKIRPRSFLSWEFKSLKLEALYSRDSSKLEALFSRDS
jgi:hypothetical protein